MSIAVATAASGLPAAPTTGHEQRLPAGSTELAGGGGGLMDDASAAPHPPWDPPTPAAGPALEPIAEAETDTQPSPRSPPSSQSQAQGTEAVRATTFHAAGPTLHGGGVAAAVALPLARTIYIGSSICDSLIRWLVHRYVGRVPRVRQVSESGGDMSQSGFCG